MPSLSRMARKPFNNDTSRRNVLKMVSSTAAFGTTGMIGRAVGTNGCLRSQALRRYSNAGSRVQAFQEQGKELLRELAEQSLIDSSSVSELPLRTFHPQKTRLRPNSTTDGTAVTVLNEGTESCRTLLMVLKNTSSHVLRIFLESETSRNYALIRSKITGKRFAIDPSVEQTRLEPTDHCDDQKDYYCGDICDSDCTFGNYIFYTTHYLEWYSCGSDFHDCCSYETGTECGAEDCYDVC